jgi:uncharacterized protein (DUF2141 family)
MINTLLFSAILLVLGANQGGKSNLTITVTNIRNDQGMVNFSLFGREGFPKETSKALRTEYTPVVKGTASITFANIPEGEYAISVFHDENNNKKIDTNMVGIPKEGVGASNNAKGRLGPPRYDDAKFELFGNGRSIVIKITYL